MDGEEIDQELGQESTAPAKRRQEGGYSRYRAKGLHGISLTMTPETHEQLRAAALAERRPLTQFLLHHGLLAAKKLSRK